LASPDRELAGAATALSPPKREDEPMKNTALRALVLLFPLLALSTQAAAAEPAATATAAPASPRLGAHAEVDLGILAFLRQGTAIAGGVTYGPFRAGLSYASFLSNPSLGGVPEGFDLRVNWLLGINAAYFIAQHTDRGLYVQGMFHIKQQGVTNKASGAHVDLDSLAAGLELGYVWKFYKGLYVAPRVGALYYVKKPQPNNQPVMVGDRTYDNSRHKDWDTYFIPTLSLGYSW
jgi:hypothetical protein